MRYETWIKLMNCGKYYGCHQKPERSFTYHNYQFPVCARCTGVIVSRVLSLLTLGIIKLSFFVEVVMTIPLIIDGTIQYVGIKESNNKRRFITGLLFGFAEMRLTIRLIRRIIKGVKKSN